MNHIVFNTTDHLTTAILIKPGTLNRPKIEKHYIEPSKLNAKNFIAIDLKYDTPKKCSAKTAKLYLEEVLLEIDDLDITTILCCDSIYFKYLTGNQKTEPFYGQVCQCSVKDYEHISVILCPNYQAIAYNPLIQEKIDISLQTLTDHLTGSYQTPGKDIIHYHEYPDSIAEIKKALQELMVYPELYIDIETKSLDFWKAGISTIAFSWDKHNGIAFGVERTTHDGCMTADDFLWRTDSDANIIKSYLIEFFINYQGKTTYHNAGFDCKILVYELWMKTLDDYPNMLEGIQIVTKNIDDTKLIAYLATNNAVQNNIGLKALAAPFAGNYAEDIKDTTKIPIFDLLKYNLIDVLSTAYVKETYEPIMIQDQQEHVYKKHLLPSVATIMQMELCGVPIDPVRVQEVKAQLQAIADKCYSFFIGSSLINDFHKKRLQAKADAKTKEAKERAKTNKQTKVYKITDSVIAEDFNPGSDLQIRELLFDYLELPVLDLTDTKQSSTKGKIIKELLNHTDNEEYKEILKHLVELAEVSIILSTFIPAFEKALQLPDGSYRMYGNFNNGGTQSLRLSSSGPNLQNLPSGSRFGKLVKSCFISPFGWLFSGSDFDSLEDKANALLTKDPNKQKVYTDGFDSHSLKTQAYWPEKMPDIDPTSVTSINSIKKKYEKYRQKSKEITFALTYQGTWHTLHKKGKFPVEEAKRIEKRYHDLYKVSDQWVEDLIDKARETGYISMIFGARIRTPILAQTTKGTKMPYPALKEGRSAGNAATQSYCFLTQRAFNEFMHRVWESEYKYDILPSILIHDAIYLVHKNSVKITKWINDNLIDCMSWQELDELKHPIIKITSSLEVYYPNWSNGIELPNGANKKEIKQIAYKAIKKLKEK